MEQLMMHQPKLSPPPSPSKLHGGGESFSFFQILPPKVGQANTQTHHFLAPLLI
jgi:hypothetical protein